MVLVSSNKKLPNLLTEQQAEVLHYIQRVFQEQGYAPSYREIQNHFGYKSVGTVQDHVRALIQKGALEKSFSKHSKKARALVPKNLSRQSQPRIPIYGEIAAGGPRESYATELGSLVVSEEYNPTETFALRVVGTSMIDIGIFEGDYVIVVRTQKVKSGDIVVALLDGETTVKKYRKDQTGVWLVPENSSLKPIPVTSENFQIQGKVVGLQRKY